ncbi:MAG: hypothetical protein AB1414_12735 [bacterium]
MEVLGLILGMLGLIFTYIWRVNGKLQKEMMQALGKIEEGAVKIEETQRDIVQMLLEHTRILDRMERKMAA